MAEYDDDASKTEEPTQKRLEQGRERGQVAVSQEVKNGAVLFAGAVGVVFMGPMLAENIAVASRTFLEMPHAFRVDIENVQEALATLCLSVGLALAPLMVLLLLVGLGANIGQFGLLWAPEKVKPDPGKMSLVKGAKRLFSMRAVVEFAKGMAKLAIVAALACGLSLPLIRDLELIPSIPILDSIGRLYVLTVRLTAGAATAMVVIAVADYLYQRHAFTRQMRMTKQELRDEHKQSEGDPHVKARIRKLRAERAQRRMMAAVPESDVVITNPTHYAVALEYKMETMPAPKMVAKGVDHLARRIREVAEENDVPVVENPPLARALWGAMEIDDEIPPEHYQAVAQVIGYVMRLKGQIA